MKSLLLTACLVCLAALCPAQRSTSINIYNHNIASGSQPSAAASHITDLLAMTPQKALLLINEGNAARQHFDLPADGWSHIWTANPHEGRGNAIFVRSAVANLMAAWVETMTQSWEHLQPKDPRVYPVVKVSLVNEPWVQFHCVNVHFPTNRQPTINAAARQESVDRLIALSASMPTLPLIICGDFNMGVNEVRQRIGNPIGGRVFSDTSVDHIIVRDGVDVGFGDTVNVHRIDRFISDHWALRYNVTFQEKNSSLVADWNLY